MLDFFSSIVDEYESCLDDDVSGINGEGKWHGKVKIVIKGKNAKID
jgi:hypothetical protein